MITHKVACVAAGWFESKRVNDNAVTMIMSALRHNTFKIWLKHKRV